MHASELYSGCARVFRRSNNIGRILERDTCRRRLLTTTLLAAA